jgi:predicted enzyme related to lactoylglutathione lyase
VNKVQHFEIPADDLERAQNFYRAVFGWEMNPYGDDTVLVSTTPSDENGLPREPGAINGDIFKRNPQVQHPLIVMTVDSIEEKLRDVEAQGGKAVSDKIEIPGTGSYAYVQDTEGNVISVWENAS